MNEQTNIPKKYSALEQEEKWQQFWKENNIYKFDKKDTTKEIFSIDTPPPTVSGKMHMGHAFGNSQQDFIARYKRMQGFNVLQPFGTDDNGLPTKLLIEKLKKVRANDLDRKEFRELCLNTLNNELKPSYTNDWKRLGISCDFDVTYSTIDKHSQKISQKSFIDLYKKGRQYRTQAPAMYCPKCQTAISQVECEDENIDSFFNDIVFKINNQELIIATTRPELLPACVAIFYHPEDDRYKNLEGKKATVPLFNFEVPIIADPRADPQKGTGIVMCCTFGDQTDMEWQKAHNLPIKEAIGRNGKMTSLAQKYEGLKIEQARKEIIQDLKENSLLKNQKPITHAVNVHERCGTPIEFVHSKQWFVKYLDLKEDMLKWGEELNWHPHHMKNRYDNWVKGLSWDWCISRQLPFGIPFPVWYCEDCEEVILADENKLPVDPTQDKPPVEKCPKCNSTKFIPETDIINTWATSSLSPTIVKELFRNEPVYEKLNKNPESLRPQGHDIISFWLFNTVVKSKLHYDMIPWTNCFINGWMLDPKGKKMSKSKGNVIEPQEMIKKYSADCLRYMAASIGLGEDVAFNEKYLIQGKKTITKIFNATKFAIMHLEDLDTQKIKDYNFDELEPTDKWILSKSQDTIKQATEFLDIFEFSKAKAVVENFFWQDLCDNYLEISKDRLYNPDTYGSNKRESAQIALYHTLLNTLKGFAPFLPFITEECYQMYFANVDNNISIHATNWPKVNPEEISEQYHKIGENLIHIIGLVRKYKSENQKSLKAQISNLTIETTKDIIESLKLCELDFKATTKAKEINYKEITTIEDSNIKATFETE